MEFIGGTAGWERTGLAQCCHAHAQLEQSIHPFLNTKPSIKSQMRNYILKAADVTGKQSSHQILSASPSSRAAHIPHNPLPPIFPTGKRSVHFYPQHNFAPKDYSQGLESGYKIHKGIWVGSVAHWLIPFFSKFTLMASIKNMQERQNR